MRARLAEIDDAHLLGVRARVTDDPVSVVVLEVVVVDATAVDPKQRVHDLGSTVIPLVSVPVSPYREHLMRT